MENPKGCGYIPPIENNLEEELLNFEKMIQEILKLSQEKNSIEIESQNEVLNLISQALDVFDAFVQFVER